MLEKVEPQKPSSQSLQMVHLLGRDYETRPDHGRELEMTLREEMVQPSRPKVVWCDNEVYCNDGYSCCFTLEGKWWCCGYSPVRYVFDLLNTALKHGCG